MSIRSKYSEEEARKLTKEEYMRNASYDDMMLLNDQIFEAAALIRESTCSDEQLRAFEVQKNIVLEIINSKPQFRLENNNIFEEKGRSGLRAADRPAFLLMCRKATQHKFDIVVVDAVSRLARNVRELFDVIYDFQELGIGILIIKERYWTYNMTHTEIIRLAIDGGLAQAESMNTGRRVENHMADLAKGGQLLGGDMFGYRLKKATNEMGDPMPQYNSLVQEPIEAFVVKTIFDLYTSDDKDKVKTSSSLCKYLIDNNMKTFNGDLNWTPQKVIRVLEHTKYMGYQLPEKSKVVDTVRKKKVSTHIEPIRDVVDENGNVIEKGNLVKIRCEPIVSEDTWWKAYAIRMKRSSKSSENVKGRKSGLRVSSDAFGRKAFCSCGYCLSRQYTHAATGEKSATYRYKCRWQIDYANKYTIGAAKKAGNIICSNEAVSEVKAWLCEKKVFGFLFKHGRSAVLQALELIEQCKQEEEILSDGNTVQGLEEEREKLRARLKNLQTMLADELIDTNSFKELKSEAEKRMAEIDELITHFELESAKKQKKTFDINVIRERLNTFIDLKGYKVGEEMIDMFVERVIYRGIVNGNDEFLWIMNLSGDTTDTSAKYKISKYSKEHSDNLKNDKNFNIVTGMNISLEECKRFCEEEAHRQFKAKYWRPITIKIAIQ